VTELPLNTRNYTNLLTMTAGANSPVTNASTIGKGSPFISVNGGGTAQNTYLQDGVVINNWYSFNTGVEGVAFGSFAIPNPDAISEFKIQTSSYDAGYGRGPGANVNVITKTGTNNFHGTAFEFFRNTSLNANDWFRNFNGQPKALINSNVYGGAFGGPIKKDKLFFFVSYQESDQKNGLTGYGSSTVTLPPIPNGDRGTCPVGFSTFGQCDAAGQAFVRGLASAVSPQAPCLNTAGSGGTQDIPTPTGSIQVQCPSGAVTDSLFNLNPVAISVLQLKLPNGNYAIPGSGAALNNGNAGYATTTFSDPASFKDHNGLGNFDWTVNSRNNVSGRYQYERDPLNAPFPVLNANLYGNFLPGNPVTTIKWNHAAILKVTSTVSNNFVNEWHAAYQRNNVLDSIGTPFKNSQVGIVDLQPGTDILSMIGVGTNCVGNGLFCLGGQYQFGGSFVDNQYIVGDQISWSHGKHTIRTGFEVEWIRFIQVYFGRSIGNPTFSRFSDFLIGRGGCVPVGPNCNGSSPAASNINNIGNFTSANAGVPFHYHALELSSFVQDDFKVNSRLTLNLGLRWEYDGFPTEERGLFSNVFPSLVNTVPLPGTTPATCSLAGFAVPANYTGLVPAGLSLAKNNGPAINGAPRRDFAPRVGFAWQPMASNRWVVRGGAGMFYDLISGSTFLGLTGISTPALGQPQITSPTLATLQNPWVIPQGVVSAGPDSCL
jgi:TonB-dependent Receptor Plug Domain